jgi:pimeloyl-ACP methyl ester carboxylesterase
MQEIRLKTPHLEMAALQWGNPDGIPVLALHGWLDNAASFTPMAPWLEDFNLVALDWPGHGRSEHRHPSARYYVIEFMWDLNAALDALGWESCHLVGHSLGSAIATVFTAAAPDRVRSLSMIDSVGPIANQASDTTERLRRSMTGMRSAARPLKVYPSVEKMIEARLANSDLSHEAARLIIERSVQPTTGGFEWSYDPKLYWSSPVYFSEDQVLDMLRHMETPTLSMSATPFSRVMHEQQYRQRLEALGGGRHELIEGGHHLHMEKPRQLAELIRDFIIEYDDPAMAIVADT